MDEVTTNAKPSHPKRKDIEDAIRHVELRTEDMEPSSGTAWAVGELRILAHAARWALELVDFENPPLSAEELAEMRRAQPGRGPAKKQRSIGDLRMMRAARSRGTTKKRK